MLEFLIDNICVLFGCRYSTDSWHAYGYIHCSYSHRRIRTMQTSYRGSSTKTIRSHPIFQFYITLYIDDILSLNNYRFGDVVDRFDPKYR